MTDGERLKQLLADAGKLQTDLADALHKSPAAVSKYCRAKVLRPSALQNVRTGLELLGIDPALIRPLTPARGAWPDQHWENLRPHLATFHRRQLEALLKIIQASPDSQRALELVIEDRLERDV